MTPQHHGCQRFNHGEQKTTHSDKPYQDAGVVGVKFHATQPGRESKTAEQRGKELKSLP